MSKYLKLFSSHSDYNAATLESPCISYCIEEREVHYKAKPKDYSTNYLTFKTLDSGTFSYTLSFSYSVNNGVTWTSVAANESTAALTSGKTVIFKATTSDACGTFSSTGRFKAWGNPLSMRLGDDFDTYESQSIPNFAFYRLFKNCIYLTDASGIILSYNPLLLSYSEMFYGCTSLTKAPEITATTVSDSSCFGMFSGCTALREAPTISVTTLAPNCYEEMFKGCTSLTKSPVLGVTTLANYCYKNMFQNCSALTVTPALPATTLEANCYFGMFSGCTSLTTVPALPATTLAYQCYSSMFNGCTSLTTAPVLPATTLTTACYALMFKDCTSLIQAPELPATTLVNYCYQQMFYDCTSLNYIKALFTTTPGSTYVQNWVYNVASTGTFVKNSSATWNVVGYDGVPTGWTIQDDSSN